MHIERIHKMIECLTEKALAELENGTEHINTCEFGEVVDMIKDLNEAEYRAVIIKSMKKADEEEEEYNKHLLRELKEEYGEDTGRRYYDDYRYMRTGRYAPKGRGSYAGRRGYEEPPYWHMPQDIDYDRDMDRHMGRMFFTEPITNDNIGMPDKMLESKYDKAKRHYTETKDMHKGSSTEDKEQKMKSLDGYIKELSTDVTNLLNDMETDERNLLRTKLSTLVSKI